MDPKELPQKDVLEVLLGLPKSSEPIIKQVAHLSLAQQHLVRHGWTAIFSYIAGIDAVTRRILESVRVMGVAPLGEECIYVPAQAVRAVQFTGIEATLFSDQAYAAASVVPEPGISNLRHAAAELPSPHTDRKKPTVTEYMRLLALANAGSASLMDYLERAALKGHFEHMGGRISKAYEERALWEARLQHASVSGASPAQVLAASGARSQN